MLKRPSFLHESSLLFVSISISISTFLSLFQSCPLSLCFYLNCIQFFLHFTHISLDNKPQLPEQDSLYYQNPRQSKRKAQRLDLFTKAYQSETQCDHLDSYLYTILKNTSLMDKKVKYMKAKSQKDWQEIELTIYQIFGWIVTFQALKQKKKSQRKRWTDFTI